MSQPATYQTNESDQTFGSLADATSINDTPDLVLVELSDGSTGYVLGRELLAAEEVTREPNSPQETVAMQESREAAEPIPLTVYAQDGRTVVGTTYANTVAEE